MKPPRSVWVITNGYGVAVDATHDEYDADRWREAGDTVVRYVLPPKPRGRKPRKRRRGNGGGA